VHGIVVVVADVVVVVVVVLITWKVLHSNVALLVELTDMFHHPAVHAEDKDMLNCFPVPFCIKKSGFLDDTFL
jgi:hypothetical protein